MYISLVTLNVNGLARHRKQGKLLSWLAINKIDVAMIQEARLSQGSADKLQGKKGSEYQIRPHYVPRPSGDQGAPLGGIACIARGKGISIQRQKGGKQNPLGGCAVFTIMCQEQEINIANIYAPAGRPKDRVTFFKAVTEWAEKLDIHNIDLIMGDLNMVMDPELDRSVTGARPTSQAEQVAWLDMVTQLCDGVVPLDVWRTIHGETKVWTRFDKAHGSSSRLDYIFIRPDWIASVISIQTHPWVGSDHSAVRLMLSLDKPGEIGPGSWKMNPTMLNSRRITEDLKAIIKNAKWDPESPIQHWIRLKQTIAAYCKRREGQEERRGEKRRRKLVTERTRLENQPPSNNTLRRLCHIRNAIIKHDEWRAMNYRYNGIAKSQTMRNKLNRQFYQSLPQANARSYQNIETLIREDGSVANTPIEVLKEAGAFYEKLYKAEPVDGAAQDYLLNGVNVKIPRDMRENLGTVLGKKSIVKSISGSSVGRAPGPDGLPNEFYKKFSKCLVKKLRHVMNYYQTEGDPSGQLSDGTVVLIYKKGRTDSLANYRPITLLNSDFKILSKILADRVKKVLKVVIGDHQSAYLDGRRIDDNILLSQLAIEHAKVFGEPVSLALLDQEKAFDRVSHDYLWKVLKRFRFPKRFIKTLKHLYANQRKRVCINGFWSDIIVASRNVPQGDSLSGLLYILVLEPLAIAIRSHVQIPGMLVDGTKVNMALYADDIMVVLTDQCSGDALMELMEYHCRASNGKVNYKKTVILKVGNGPVVRLGEAKLILPPQQVMLCSQERYLGIPIGQQVDYHPVWLKVECAIREMAAKLRRERHDLKIRVILSKSMLLSKAHFLARFTPVPTGVLERIEAVVAKYIWNGTAATLNKMASTLPLAEGGIKAMDLRLHVMASKVCLVSRMEACPDLPWVKIVVKTLAGATYRTENPIRERITKPWRQHVSSRSALAMEPVLNSIMSAWKSSRHIFVQDIPTTCCEALSINFWYPLGSKANAKIFSCVSWRTISSGIYGRADYLGDIWDPIEEKVLLEPNGVCSSEQWRNRQNAVKALIERLDPAILAVLRETKSSARNLFNKRRREFCTVALKHGEGSIPLQSIKHNILYSKLLHEANRQEAEKAKARIQPLLDLMDIPEEEQTKVRSSIWLGARSKEFLPKASDYIWRMLHGRNIYGDKLNGPLLENGICHECGVVCTEEHLLIKCSIAGKLWDARRTLWGKMAGNYKGYSPRPKTVDKLKLTLCRPTTKMANDRSRHRILTSLLVWVLWKQATRQWYDNEPMTGQGALSLYRKLILDQIHVDRIECDSTWKGDKKKQLEAKFLATWGFPRSQLTIGGTPKCLLAI